MGPKKHPEGDNKMIIKNIGLQCAILTIMILALPTIAAADDDDEFYLSLGTSLSVGVQPILFGADIGENQLTDDGYADQLTDILAAESDDLRLVKLGCPGETTITMITGGICAFPNGSQLAEAINFLNTHGDDVELITIDMGANDLLEGGCVIDTVVDPVCIQGVIVQISGNLPIILSALREAADPDTLIVGMNYYNPFLAFWLIGADGQSLAIDSALVVNFINNNVLGPTYGAFGIPVADVASAFLSNDFATLVPFPLPAPNNFVPLNVAVICQLTYMCVPDPIGPNIHANPTGYGVIAATFAALLDLEDDDDDDDDDDD